MTSSMPSGFQVWPLLCAPAAAPHSNRQAKSNLFFIGNDFRKYTHNLLQNHLATGLRVREAGGQGGVIQTLNP
jgi:hypothetical protein